MMNRIFKTIFNKARGTYMVTGEHTRAHGKTKSVAAVVALALAGAMVAGPAMAVVDNPYTNEEIYKSAVGYSYGDELSINSTTNS